jgi:hypothetical protein
MLRSQAMLTLKSSVIAAASLTLAINLSASKLSEKLGILQIKEIAGLDPSRKSPLYLWSTNATARQMALLTIDTDIKPAYAALLVVADKHSCKGLLASEPSL